MNHMLSAVYILVIWDWEFVLILESCLIKFSSRSRSVAKFEGIPKYWSIGILKASEFNYGTLDVLGDLGDESFRLLDFSFLGLFDNSLGLFEPWSDFCVTYLDFDFDLFFSLYLLWDSARLNWHQNNIQKNMNTNNHNNDK